MTSSCTLQHVTHEVSLSLADLKQLSAEKLQEGYRVVINDGKEGCELLSACASCL